MFSKFMQLSQHELYDTANYYLKKNSYDTAFVYFNLFIKTIPQNADIEQQKKLLMQIFLYLIYMEIHLTIATLMSYILKHC